MLLNLRKRKTNFEHRSTQRWLNIFGLFEWNKVYQLLNKKTLKTYYISFLEFCLFGFTLNIENDFREHLLRVLTHLNILINFKTRIRHYFFRVISMAWVILGHTFLNTLFLPTQNPQFIEKVRLWNCTIFHLKQNNDRFFLIEQLWKFKYFMHKIIRLVCLSFFWAAWHMYKNPVERFSFSWVEL